MRSEKITLEAIEAFEREGLGSVVNAVAELLNSPDGLEKHGVQGWVVLGNRELAGKMFGHYAQDCKGQIRDAKSKHPTIVHFCSRAIQLTARGIRGLR